MRQMVSRTLTSLLFMLAVVGAMAGVEAQRPEKVPRIGYLVVSPFAEPVVSENSAHGSGRAVVVAQQPAQPLVASNVGADERAGPCRDQSVTEPLMVPLPVVMRYELVDRADQVPFSEQDQFVQTLLADRPYEPFRVSVGVRSLDRSQDDTHSRLIEEPSKFLRPLAVSVADQHLMAG